MILSISLITTYLKTLAKKIKFELITKGSDMQVLDGASVTELKRNNLSNTYTNSLLNISLNNSNINTWLKSFRTTLTVSNDLKQLLETTLLLASEHVSIQIFN